VRNQIEATMPASPLLSRGLTIIVSPMNDRPGEDDRRYRFAEIRRVGMLQLKPKPDWISAIGAGGGQTYNGAVDPPLAAIALSDVYHASDDGLPSRTHAS